MILSREKQIQFLQEELKKQTDDFKMKLDSSAVDLLLNKNKLFVAIFVKFMSNGEMLLKLPASRPLPRKNEFFYCFTLPESLKRYKDWGNLTYRDLIKRETKATEVKCIWHGASDDSRFFLAGFKGVSEAFRRYIEQAPGGIVNLGPEVPPFEYLANLERVVRSRHPKCDDILDKDYDAVGFTPILLDSNKDISQIVQEDHISSDIIILQGPPGTGKTTKISDLCMSLCSMGKSVLVTALTNRALMEVAIKLQKTEMMKNGDIFKTNLTTDEEKSVHNLMNAETVQPLPGKLMLSTFYLTSGMAASSFDGPLFDYVIVDEASQAFLPMLAAANMLGKKNLWVGDVRQMPPVVQLPTLRISRMGFSPIIEGLNTVTSSGLFKTYQLTDTYRLGNRAAAFTGIFYNNTLKSKSELNGLFENIDGPIIVPMKMSKGDHTPKNAIEKAVSLAKGILSKSNDAEVAILSHRTNTTTALQTEVVRQIGMSKRVLVDTVARVQGITKDYTIYVIPDTDSKLYSLELRLFNVATSRAIINTYIICPNDVLEFSYMSTEVRQFLTQLK